MMDRMHWAWGMFERALRRTDATIEYGPCGEVIIELVPPPVVELQDYRMN